MTNEQFTEELKKLNIDKVCKYNLQELANFIDWHADKAEVAEYYHSQLFCIATKLSEKNKEE